MIRTRHQGVQTDTSRIRVGRHSSQVSYWLATTPSPQEATVFVSVAQ